MSEYERIIESEVETCGDPNCIGCRVEILKVFAAGLLEDTDRTEGLSVAHEAGLNLLLAAAVAFREADENLTLTDYIAAASASFDAERKLNDMRYANSSTKH